MLDVRGDNRQQRGEGKRMNPSSMKRSTNKSRSLRALQTNAEALLWKALRNRQLSRWKFRRQHPIDRYIVDFVTIDGKLIVEVDGETHSSAKSLRCDAERDRTLNSFGFHIIRASNADVYGNLDGVKEIIASTLGSV